MHGIGSGLERIYFGGYISRNYLLAQLIGLNCVTGMSLMFPKDLLSMNEFRQLSSHLAEDYFLAKLIRDKGNHSQQCQMSRLYHLHYIISYDSYAM